MNVDIIVLNCQKCNQVLNGYKSLGMIDELGVGVSWVSRGQLCEQVVGRPTQLIYISDI